MRRVTVESPYAGDVASHVEYAKRCMLDCLHRGEAPYASHLLYPGILDDDKPEERALGIAAGIAWGQSAELVAVYVDMGISRGMRQGIRAAVERGTSIVFRSLVGAPTTISAETMAALLEPG